MLRAARPWPVVMLLAVTAALGAGRAEAAGTAYGVDTAEVGDVGNCKVESWVSFASNSDFIAVTDPTCVFDLGRPIEFSAQIQRSRSDGDWDTSIAPKIKTNIAPATSGPTRFSAERFA